MNAGKIFSVYNKMIFILLFVGIITIIWISSCSRNLSIFPTDETIDNISMDEAEKRLPFTLCMPRYLPEGINPTPSITYYARWGDPEASEVRLNFYNSDYSKIMLQVIESYQPSEDTVITFRPLNSLQHSLLNLINWSSSGNETSLEIIDQYETNYYSYQNGKEIYWFFEINKPEDQSANLVEWWNDPIHYQIFSQLSTDDVQEIGNSMEICNLQPTSTP